MANGARFREQRRWALHTLRDFGLGKNIAEEAILTELVDQRMKIERESAGRKKAIDPTAALISSVANVICALVFGERLGGDPEFERMREILDFFVMFSSTKVAKMLIAPYVFSSNSSNKEQNSINTTLSFFRILCILTNLYDGLPNFKHKMPLQGASS